MTDWQAAYARLERARRELEAMGSESPETLRAILRRRAQALAVPSVAATPAADVELLVFSLGGESYALETAAVLEVARLDTLTPVPCGSGSLLGVVNHRGHLRAVFDLGRLLRLDPRGLAAADWLVFVHAEGMTFALAVDALNGVVGLSSAEFAPAAAASGEGRPAYVHRVTSGLAGVINLKSLIRNPGFLVDEEVV